MMAKWKGGCLSSGPIGLVYSFHAEGTSFFKKTTSDAIRQCPFHRKR